MLLSSPQKRGPSISEAEILFDAEINTGGLVSTGSPLARGRQRRGSRTTTERLEPYIPTALSNSTASAWPSLTIFSLLNALILSAESGGCASGVTATSLRAEYWLTFLTRSSCPSVVIIQRSSSRAVFGCGALAGTTPMNCASASPSSQTISSIGEPSTLASIAR